jgi:hypothetical protein
VGPVGAKPPNLANTISGFGPGDAIDFSAVAFATRDKVVDNGGKVSVETSGGATVASFQLSGFSGSLSIANDGFGKVKVTDPSSAAALAPASTGGFGSLADLLGEYGSELTAPFSMPANDPLAFDAWTALSPSAGVDPGGSGFHGAPNPGGTGLFLDANLGGPREASSIGLALNSYGDGPGHGPGPSG